MGNCERELRVGLCGGWEVVRMWWVVVVRWSGGVVRGVVNGGRAGEGWYFRIELTGILQYWQSIELRLQIIEVHQVACCKIRNPLGGGVCETSKNISKKGAVCHLCPLKKSKKAKMCLLCSMPSRHCEPEFPKLPRATRLHPSAGVARCP